jgi:hypothetical protein
MLAVAAYVATLGRLDDGATGILTSSARTGEIAVSNTEVDDALVGGGESPRGLSKSSADCRET